jgi:outer membrane protein OmpA-like peptidoglycan-associated protein
LETLIEAGKSGKRRFMSRSRYTRIVTALLVGGLVLLAQERNPTQKSSAQVLEPQSISPVPIFRIEVVERTTKAVNYFHRSGQTKIDFQGTPLMSGSKGMATVESERGVIHVKAEFKELTPPSSFGSEYLTYVLWAISPDGRPVNLGELTLSDYGKGSSTKLETSSDIQTFGMIVTAEPYYAVTQPSDVVVLENIVRRDTQGIIEQINAKFELLPRGMYTSNGRAPGFVPIQVGKKNPFELYEAENAVQLARLAGADRYAADSFQKAVEALQNAEGYQRGRPGQKMVITAAREAALRAEDARVITLRREKEEAQEHERQAALARENAEREKAEVARRQADLETQRRAQAETERSAAERAKIDAVTAAQASERERMAAERARAEADRQKQEAETARQAAVAQQQQLTAEADRAKAELDRQKQEAEAARQAAIAQQQQLTAEADRTKAELDRQKREAEDARGAALAQQQQLAADVDRARQAAADADRQRRQAEQNQAQLRQQLLSQFNAILQTRDTARGLIVNMSDVLFDTGSYSLTAGAREKLAKVSGIILGHPGLKIAVEGHTDSVGGDDYNMKLSENRANSVRGYLVAQRIDSTNVTAQGFGKTTPVADNSTAAGRQRNRRVEMVVSGEILGTTLTGVRTSSPVTTP